MDITEYFGVVILLFLMSMSSERAADFLKHYLGEGNNRLNIRFANAFELAVAAFGCRMIEKIYRFICYLVRMNAIFPVM